MESREGACLRNTFSIIASTSQAGRSNPSPTEACTELPRHYVPPVSSGLTSGTDSNDTGEEECGGRGGRRKCADAFRRPAEAGEKRVDKRIAAEGGAPPIGRFF